MAAASTHSASLTAQDLVDQFRRQGRFDDLRRDLMKAFQESDCKTSFVTKLEDIVLDKLAYDQRRLNAQHSDRLGNRRTSNNQPRINLTASSKERHEDVMKELERHTLYDRTLSDIEARFVNRTTIESTLVELLDQIRPASKRRKLSSSPHQKDSTPLPPSQTDQLKSDPHQLDHRVSNDPQTNLSSRLETDRDQQLPSSVNLQVEIPQQSHPSVDSDIKIDPTSHASTARDRSSVLHLPSITSADLQEVPSSIDGTQARDSTSEHSLSHKLGQPSPPLSSAPTSGLDGSSLISSRLALDMSSSSRRPSLLEKVSVGTSVDGAPLSSRSSLSLDKPPPTSLSSLLGRLAHETASSRRGSATLDGAPLLTYTDASPSQTSSQPTLSSVQDSTKPPSSQTSSPNKPERVVIPTTDTSPPSTLDAKVQAWEPVKASSAIDGSSIDSAVSNFLESLGLSPGDEPGPESKPSGPDT